MQQTTGDHKIYANWAQDLQDLVDHHEEKIRLLRLCTNDGFILQTMMQIYECLEGEKKSLLLDIFEDRKMTCLQIGYLFAKCDYRPLTTLKFLEYLHTRPGNVTTIHLIREEYHKFCKEGNKGVDQGAPQSKGKESQPSPGTQDSLFPERLQSEGPVPFESQEETEEARPPPIPPSAPLASRRGHPTSAKEYFILMSKVVLTFEKYAQHDQECRVRSLTHLRILLVKLFLQRPDDKYTIESLNPSISLRDQLGPIIESVKKRMIHNSKRRKRRKKRKRKMKLEKERKKAQDKAMEKNKQMGMDGNRCQICYERCPTLMDLPQRAYEWHLKVCASCFQEAKNFKY